MRLLILKLKFFLFIKTNIVVHHTPSYLSSGLIRQLGLTSLSESCQKYQIIAVSSEHVSSVLFGCIQHKIWGGKHTSLRGMGRGGMEGCRTATKGDHQVKNGGRSRGKEEKIGAGVKEGRKGI